MEPTIRIARNDCASEVDFRGKNLYFNWENCQSHSILGPKLDKIEYIKTLMDRPDNEGDLLALSRLMVDWELYENGWLVTKYENVHLFYYLTQMRVGCMVFCRPKELNYLSS